MPMILTGTIDLAVAEAATGHVSISIAWSGCAERPHSGVVFSACSQICLLAAMSAFPQSGLQWEIARCRRCANSRPRRSNCGFPLHATIGREQMQQMKWVVRLVDHLVGDGDQRRWYRQAEHPGGFGVDRQLELPRTARPGRSAGLARLRIHWETENPHCFCSISICFVIRMAFCA